MGRGRRGRKGPKGLRGRRGSRRKEASLTAKRDSSLLSEKEQKTTAEMQFFEREACHPVPLLSFLRSLPLQSPPLLPSSQPHFRGVTAFKSPSLPPCLPVDLSLFRCGSHIYEQPSIDQERQPHFKLPRRQGVRNVRVRTYVVQNSGKQTGRSRRERQ